MQARWPPWPQPWHQVQIAEPFGRGAEKGANVSISESETGSVGTEDWVEAWEVVSESKYELVRVDEVGCVCFRSVDHSDGGSRHMQMEHGAWGVLQR
jgi:hypothetical protein